MTTLVVGFLFITGVCGQERTFGASDRPPASPPERAALPADATRAVAKPAFSGRVVGINLASETLSLKSTRDTVTFDASRPILSGYRALSDIRVGDTVEVSYVPDGIKVIRLAGRPLAHTEKPPAGPQRRRAGLLRRGPRRSGSDFDDVDANKDGHITPVELSVLFPDITLDWFRQHDANKDGYLNRTEFADMLRQQRAASKTK
jgi:hypothetical protein